MASENNLPSSEEGERVLDDDDEDSVPEDEDEDEDQEDDVEAKILQLQDQFQEVKQQRKEARLIPRPDSPTSAKKRARSAERSRYLQRSTQETREDGGRSRCEFAPRPQSASAALDRKIVNSVASKVATVKEEPATFMRDLGLGDGEDGSGRGREGRGGGSSSTLETCGEAPQRGVFHLDSILHSCEEETPGDSRIVEEEEEEEEQADEWATAEEERRRRREELQRRRKALEDRIPTQHKPEKPPPPPKTRLETGLDFLRRDISHVVAKAAVVMPRGEGGGDGDGRTRGRRGGGGGEGRGNDDGDGDGDGDELAHARRVNRLAMREGMLGLRRSGAALQPASGSSTSGGSPRRAANARGARAAAATTSAGKANNPRPRTAGWQPAGKASTTEREWERVAAAAAAAAAASSSSPTSFGLIPSASPSPSPSGAAVWRPVGEKPSGLAEASARYVPLNATPHSCVQAVPRRVRNGGENRVRADSDDPVRSAKARVALHESNRALGLPEPCDFEEATLMGLHVRLKEANACARQLGLGTRYRSVPAGSRMIRIEVYYLDERGGTDGASGETGGEDEAKNKRRRRKKRFVSVDAFMKSESRLLLQASYGVGGNVFRAMRENQRQNRPLSAAAAGSVKPSKFIAAAGSAKPGTTAARVKSDAAKLPSWR